MNLLITLIGTFLLLVSLAAVGLGVFMATASGTRQSGGYFALWWVPGAAAAAGVIMRDGVTVLVGLLCFLVAGAVFAWDGRRPGLASLPASRPSGEGRPGARIDATGASERTTKENTVGSSRSRRVS